MPTLTPNQAAKQTGLSRRSIMRAIEAGELDARRNNRNQWQVDATTLAQWAPSAQPMGDAQSAPTLLPSSVHEMQARVAVLETELVGMRDLVARADARAEAERNRADAEQRRADAAEAATQDARTDRDRWHSQAERMAQIERRPKIFGWFRR